MNKTKIEWTDYSWNPITGCNHGCWYCYANKLFTRFHKSFEPTYHPERLKEPWELKKPSKIFVCSVADLFAPWTPEPWRDAVLGSICDCPVDHVFQLLTKNPERIPNARFGFNDFRFNPRNVWLGTTVTNVDGDWKNIGEIKRVSGGTKFVSFEPLLGPLPSEVSLEGIDWVIVGKLTGSKKVKLHFEWLASIFDQTGDFGIPLFMKNNLRQEFPDLRLMQQFPKGDSS